MVEDIMMIEFTLKVGGDTVALFNKNLVTEEEVRDWIIHCSNFYNPRIVIISKEQYLNLRGGEVK